jgi:hypothetical protein
MRCRCCLTRSRSRCLILVRRRPGCLTFEHPCLGLDETGQGARLGRRHREGPFDNRALTRRSAPRRGQPASPLHWTERADLCVVTGLSGCRGKQIFGGWWGCGQRGHAPGWPLGVDVRSRDWASSYERVAVADAGDMLLIVGGLMGGLL